MLHGTASPAEVFHRNLVDAVSNVEGKKVKYLFAIINTYPYYY